MSTAKNVELAPNSSILFQNILLHSFQELSSRLFTKITRLGHLRQSYQKSNEVLLTIIGITMNLMGNVLLSLLK
jgi:hypothetical protein